MTDKLAAGFAGRQIETQMGTLRLDAERFADDARQYADAIARGTNPHAGEANRLLQSMVQIAQAASRTQGIRETVSYLAPADGQL